VESIRRHILAAAVAAVSLGMAPAAEAAVTVGSDLSRAPTGAVCAGGPCTLFQQYAPTGAPLALAMPADGVLVRWRVRAGTVGSHDLRLRTARPAPWGYYSIVSSSDSVPAASLAQGVNEVAARIPVKKGDRLALDAGPGWVVTATASGGTARTWYPVPATGVTAPSFYSRLRPVELALNADVEPDADADGYGDETQDLCSTDRSTHGRCPPPPPPPPPPPDLRAPTVRLTGASVQSPRSLFMNVVLDEPGTAVATGTVKLPSARRPFALESVAAGLQGAHSRRKVQLRVRGRKHLRSTLRAVRRGLGLRAVVKVVARDAAGNTAVATRSVLLSR
jgi:hypothetical protein